MNEWPTILTIVGIAVIFFALAMLGLGIGVIFNRKALRGSCGGSGKHRMDPNGKELRCDACPNSDDPNAGPCELGETEPSA
jgi:hypothetical protein